MSVPDVWVGLTRKRSIEGSQQLQIRYAFDHWPRDLVDATMKGSARKKLAEGAFQRGRDHDAGAECLHLTKTFDKKSWLWNNHRNMIIGHIRSRSCLFINLLRTTYPLSAAQTSINQMVAKLQLGKLCPAYAPLRSRPRSSAGRRRRARPFESPAGSRARPCSGALVVYLGTFTTRVGGGVNFSSNQTISLETSWSIANSLQPIYTCNLIAAKCTDFRKLSEISRNAGKSGVFSSWTYLQKLQELKFRRHFAKSRK